MRSNYYKKKQDLHFLMKEFRQSHNNVFCYKGDRRVTGMMFLSISLSHNAKNIFIINSFTGYNTTFSLFSLGKIKSCTLLWRGFFKIRKLLKCLESQISQGNLIKEGGAYWYYRLEPITTRSKTVAAQNSFFHLGYLKKHAYYVPSNMCKHCSKLKCPNATNCLNEIEEDKSGWKNSMECWMISHLLCCSILERTNFILLYLMYIIMYEYDVMYLTGTNLPY